MINNIVNYLRSAQIRDDFPTRIRLPNDYAASVEGSLCNKKTDTYDYFRFRPIVFPIK